MRTALLAALAVALVVVLWWIRDDEQARAERREAAPEAIEPPEPVPEIIDEPPPAEKATEPTPPLPPDPVGRGECALFVRVVDAATGQPVATEIDLWRLNAPGNEHWLEGDQLQLTTAIAAEGTTLRDLPEGEYRPVCAAQRFAAEDPPPVRVAGPLTDVAIAIELPGTFHVLLRLFDVNGHPAPAAGVRRSGESWSDRGHDPAWRKRRERRAPRPVSAFFSVGSGGGAGRFSSGRHPAQPQPPAGFRLGPVYESTKRRGKTWHFRAEVEGLSDVRVFVRGDRTDERTYVGVMVPIETLVREVRLPDGRPVTAAGAQVDATGTAVLAEEATQPDFWRHLAIDVTVRMSGFKRLTFEHRLADPPPVHVLEPE